MNELHCLFQHIAKVMMVLREKKAWAIPFLVLLFIYGVVEWIFFVGSTYFEIIREGTNYRPTEGDWTGLLHIYYLLLTSPLVIIIAVVLGRWIVMGQHSKAIKLMITLAIFLAYGGVHLSFLWWAHPPG
ncbi:hypothetical protein QU487_17510 [Crenobacter sp. SG2305]|uniref:hypothetical protein n=1 Tax=Crenobacter oryzisoli TaxID=3056844 RepID=UPI0025AAE2F4|nr:hypothetical protein [Crenobacter sp. SG2305]MDN0084536.1 hypothetical protein [Crenobacter sp. SG2305]